MTFTMVRIWGSLKVEPLGNPQGDPSAHGLGYADTVPSQDNLGMNWNWCQHNLVREQMDHPVDSHLDLLQCYKS